MTGDPFTAAEAFTLSQEGGWADNPADPGGCTMQGITLTVFRAWRHDPSAQPDDLRAIWPSEVAAIYRALYWNPIEGVRLPPGVSLSVFDAAVNLGVRRSTMLLQAALSLTQDGTVGPITLKAASRAATNMLLSRLKTEREAFYKCCKGFSLFGKDWLNRSEACFLAARAVAGLAAINSSKLQ